MINRTKKIIIYLDMVLLVMTGAWIVFGVSQGIDSIELVYNYIYVFVVTVTLILNMKLIYKK